MGNRDLSGTTWPLVLRQVTRHRYLVQSLAPFRFFVFCWDTFYGRPEKGIEFNGRFSGNKLFSDLRIVNDLTYHLRPLAEIGGTQ